MMEHMKLPELLAPAGSPEVMKACFAAGADAVYMGLNAFSARAYAANTGVESYIEAIRYAHLRGKKLYLTLNTLMKEEELQNEVLPLITPLYQAGLDAVIVQDTGLFCFLSEHFPDLPLHASTQMSVSSFDAVAFLNEKLPLRRYVPARELSLEELREIVKREDAELECFIHGALCCSYSGQCLMSSLFGGRSGNRGRCAQPCRLDYRPEVQGKTYPEESILSLKDLNTLKILPEIVDAGIRSLKIEGRMKSAEYAAGVSSIYRKYLDLYAEKGREGYLVDPEDERKLLSLYRRRGYTVGYYHRQNSKEMVSFSVSEEQEDRAFLEELREKYIQEELRVPAAVCYQVKEGAPLSLTLSLHLMDEDFLYTAFSEEPPEEARTRATQKEEIEKQLKKLGGTFIYAKEVSGEVSEGLFLPVSALNELRRAAVKGLEEKILGHYERSDARAAAPADAGSLEKEVLTEKDILPAKEASSPVLSAHVYTEEQFSAALSAPGIGRILLESTLFPPETWKAAADRIHDAQKEAYFVFPEVFRTLARNLFENHKNDLISAGFDAFLVRNFEEAGWINRNLPGSRMQADHRLYAFNSRSAAFLKAGGFSCLTVPAELNAREIHEAALYGEELMVYGRLPLMIMANCIKKDTAGCDKKPGVSYITDRRGFRMPVFNQCPYCYNVILNAEPLSLLRERDAVFSLRPSSLRLTFTTESGKETAERIRAFTEVFLHGSTPEPEDFSYTRGHFRRGVE